VDFTEDNEFVDSVSGYPRNSLAVVDFFAKDHTGSYELLAGPIGSPVNVVNMSFVCSPELIRSTST
jgi:hypothetical protein